MEMRSRRPSRSILGLVVISLLGCRPGEPGATTETERPSAVASLTASAEPPDEAYARAEPGRELVFPRDHGPHPAFQTEWWYLTANLESPEGRRFGVQWTLFRRALAPEMPARNSAWATRQIYLGHFAVSDLDAGEHHSYERLARGAAGLAGAEIEPLAVWLEDWRLEASGANAGFPWRVTARGLGGEDVSLPGSRLELTIEPEKPLVLQGEAGFSPKHLGDDGEPGGASHYYSFTRLAATGTIGIGDASWPVSGTAWLDREWSTSVLAPDQTGWDWFALQIDDGPLAAHDLMYYQLRLDPAIGPALDPALGPEVDPASSGVLVDPVGVATRLARNDVILEVLEHWTSPEGTVYPASWRLRVPAQGIEWRINPLLADQELDVAFRYWEGAVEVRDAAGDRSGDGVIGRGYVELVGYSDEAPDPAPLLD